MAQEKSSSSTTSRSIKEIDAELDVTVQRLGRTVDELAVRVSPAELKRKARESVDAAIQGAKESARATAHDAVYDEQGDLRYDRIAGALGGVSAVAFLLGGARRLFHKG